MRLFGETQLEADNHKSAGITPQSIIHQQLSLRDHCRDDLS